MERILNNSSSKLTTNDKARLYTNLSLFYEKNGDTAKQKYYLKEAVKMNPTAPNAFDALGRFYLRNNSENNKQKALALFEKACLLNGDMKYRYNYAIAQYLCGNTAKAKILFEAIPEDGQEYRAALYGLGVCSFFSGEKQQAINIANRLAVNCNEDYVTESQVADLYFLCDEYARHNEMYDYSTDNYYLDENLLAPYFYSLYKQGKSEELSRKFKEVMSAKDNDIAYSKTEELDENYTETDREECIRSYQKEKEAIAAVYDKIINEHYKPDITINLYPIYGCYLIDCPRHQLIT